MAEVITIAAGKGGVGKTATTVNLAAAMANDGYKVLVIDLDNQANSTMFTTGHRLQENFYDKKGIFQIARGMGLENVNVMDYVVAGHIDGVDVIPSNFATPKLEEQLRLWALDNDKDAIEFLYELIGEILDNRHYDYILIDTPPAQNSLSVKMSMYASTFVIIPVRLEDQSAESLMLTDEIRNKINKEYDLDVELLGVLPTMVEKTSLTTYFLETAFKITDKDENPDYYNMAEQFKDKLFNTHIRKGNAINESAFDKMPAVISYKKSNPSKDYVALWKEIQERLPSDEE